MPLALELGMECLMQKPGPATDLWAERSNDVVGLTR